MEEAEGKQELRLLLLPLPLTHLLVLPYPPTPPLSPFSVCPSIQSFSAAAFEKEKGDRRENIEAEGSSEAQNILSFIYLPL